MTSMMKSGRDHRACGLITDVAQSSHRTCDVLLISSCSLVLE